MWVHLDCVLYEEGLPVVCVLVCVSVYTHLCSAFVKGQLYVEDRP